MERPPVREASLEDAPAIARVHVDTWRIAYSGIVPAEVLARLSYESREALWRDVIGGETLVYVAERSGVEVVGFASGGLRAAEQYPDYDGELLAIYILESQQRSGTGRLLFGSVARGFVEKGARAMLLWVLTENPARGFYEALGGRLLGKREVEIGGAALEASAYGWPDLRTIV